MKDTNILPEVIPDIKMNLTENCILYPESEGIVNNRKIFLLIHPGFERPQWSFIIVKT